MFSQALIGTLIALLGVLDLAPIQVLLTYAQTLKKCFKTIVSESIFQEESNTSSF